MAYNVADIIEKAVNIAVRRRVVYQKIGQDKGDILSIKILTKVLNKEVNKTIEYYETLLNLVNDRDFEEIDFSIYDKISFLINDFNNRINTENVRNARELLNFSLEMEKAVYSLFLDIQGRFVKTGDDVRTNTYRILTDIIENKAKHIEMLEQLRE
ncbi:hypothetical protein [Desulfosporosinus meridiei]|uniref:Rubrerythrin diiron-binding domain-containing protein n=1 Tax=Desulfosporosinus meridiei (strain ATCC BAA-275 / DSM 13257 / KCTC 12902 / NCIMB 13706 / S10) TaxID=768704 RepID=J7IUK1_DESMD|nr:hypothetical protein [Desulfosporosinus meridiei]AFQ45405.1 hypothetical protein Desmer_3565 [Desulfosporosinus meridiei DSM 13257]